MIFTDLQEFSINKFNEENNYLSYGNSALPHLKGCSFPKKPSHQLELVLPAEAIVDKSFEHYQHENTLIQDYLAQE